jgi:hypothetical protein
MEFMIIFGVVFYLFTQNVFAKPPEKPKPEEEFGKAIAKYLKEGTIQVKIEK